MKIHLLTEHLQKKLPFLIHAVSSRSQLPILLHILMETRDGKLYLYATDLEIGIEVIIPATIEEEGSVAVPARLFFDLVTSLPIDTITLETTDSNIEIKGKKTHTTLQIMAKDEFPVLYDEKGSIVDVQDITELRNHLEHVAFAASTDTTRPSLSGVMIKRKDETFLLVATDGYRLSLQEVKRQTSEGDTSEAFIIPVRVIREVMGLKEKGSVTMSLSKRSNQILFSQEDSVLVGRLIEADFPPYEKILPKSYSTKIFFDREEMQKAIKVCSLFARDAGNIITLSLLSGKTVVSAHAASLGEHVVDVESRLEGEEKEIAFNAKYLLDLFSNVDAEHMTFEMTGPLNPGVFKIDGDSSFLHLIMPIRTQV